MKRLPVPGASHMFDTLLSNGVKAAGELASAQKTLEPMTNNLAASVWALCVNVVWKQGAEKPLAEDEKKWNDRKNRCAFNKRKFGNYEDACLVTQVIIREYALDDDSDHLELGPTSQYAIAHAVVDVQEVWMNQGNIAQFGGVNEADFLFLLESEHGLWNCHKRTPFRKKAQAFRDALAKTVAELSGIMSAITIDCAKNPIAGADIETRSKNAMNRVDELGKEIIAKAEIAISVLLAKDAEMLCEEMTKARSLIDDQRKVLQDNQKQARKLEVEDTTGGCTTTGSEDAPADNTPDEGDDTIISPGGIVVGGYERSGTWAGLPKAAFQGYMDGLSVEALFDVVFKKLGISPTAGTHTWESVCDGTLTVSVSHKTIK